MSKTLIIPDIHGDRDLLLDILFVNSDADRIIQLGDLANCVWSSRDGDVECLEIAKTYGFELLVGNHEHPYFDGPRFSGYCNYHEVGDILRSLYFLGQYKAATTVNGILITHAGLHPAIATRYSSAEEAADNLNEAWQQYPTCALFSAIGRIRGGKFDYGGILWRDHSERISQKFPQIYGHTPGDNFRRKNNAICIDSKKGYMV